MKHVDLRSTKLPGASFLWKAFGVYTQIKIIQLIQSKWIAFILSQLRIFSMAFLTVKELHG